MRTLEGLFSKKRTLEGKGRIMESLARGPTEEDPGRHQSIAYQRTPVTSLLTGAACMIHFVIYSLSLRLTQEREWREIHGLK
jgi:hypothetical protein